MSSTTVGRSGRTPAKHALMWKLIGREVGASNRMPDEFDRLVWFDLTAGDGVVADGAEWERNCSPGILAYHARNSLKPVNIRLSERSFETCNRLEESLHEHLPRLGYENTGASYDLLVNRDVWTHGPVKGRPGDVYITVAHEDGCDVGTEWVTDRTAVLVCHDPNTVHQRAMRPTFMSELRDITPWCQGISTMGCNVGGLKRLPIEERKPWFDFVAEQHDNLHGWHDLTLAAIEGDAGQWAYLVTHAKAWTKETGDFCRNAFKSHGMTLEVASYRSEPDPFADMQRRLFLRTTEREA
jgi:hypothetical protein